MVVVLFRTPTVSVSHLAAKTSHRLEMLGAPSSDQNLMTSTETPAGLGLSSRDRVAVDLHNRLAVLSVRNARTSEARSNSAGIHLRQLVSQVVPTCDGRQTVSLCRVLEVRFEDMTYHRSRSNPTRPARSVKHFRA